ncbi:GNAT family N-acetyltransferase [Microbacterium sp. ISL-59]|uniref:GNAT family N-acetyltransferase n=1 Tax=Microbacterium sp. ISL-59 TaxID=2819159 RepID=UPI001BEC0997|nr:GNAT family N-acetyltransferase [Microbacterium sp. ISL-59]MBT2497414.1 GNAT family N-acetyltransferase [Microbacterium sp. ISL-59]
MDSLRLRLWSENDLELLHAANTPAMTAHLNGPETEEQVVERQARYLRLVASGEARMFVIEDAAGASLGSIGFWRMDWRDEPALETGWFVRPEAQGRGVASKALALLIDDARAHRGDRRFLTAFPGVDNPASNGVCRRNGFALVGTKTEEFRGADLSENEWVLDLSSPGTPAL